MNQTKKTLLLAAGLVVLLAAAALGYNALSKNYTPQGNGGLLNPDGGGISSDTEESTGGTVSTGDPAETEMPETVNPDSEDGLELDLAPDFTVKNVAGEDVKLSDFMGKPVVINFWATWCGPCKSELPAFNAAYEAHHEEMEFLMVNLDEGDQSEVTDFMTKNGYTFPVYFDTTTLAAATYGAYSIPLTVFVSGDGYILGGQYGAMDGETLEGLIDTVLTYYVTVGDLVTEPGGVG